MTGVQGNVDSFRRQVQRIVASQEFASLRQVREFLLYVSEAAFEGRSSIDQVELADRVLHRGKDFNPLDDASVRKYATILRQKLRSYYETEGASDPVLVSLPVRSYVPHFELRPESAEVTPERASAPPVRRRASWLLWIAAVILVCLVAVSLEVFWSWSPRSDPTRPTFILTTVPGDIMHATNDLPGNAIRLGPVLGDVDEVTVRMRFTPDRATQQAGIFVFSDPDQYVKFGRQFLSRSQLEFGLEHQGRYQKPVNTFTFDPDGQNGEPVWLSIRREHSRNRAFISNDGERWRSVGNILEMPGPETKARAAIFADNGRSNAPAAEAVFDHLSVGSSFHDWPTGRADLSQFPDWKLESTSENALSAWSVDSEALAFSFTSGARAYSCLLDKPIPKGDWVISTRMDFLSLNGEELPQASCCGGPKVSSG